MTLPSDGRTSGDPPNTDGWQRAGYAAPDCERFAGNPAGGHGRAVGQHGHDADGWHRAGYATPECERFEQLAGV